MDSARVETNLNDIFSAFTSSTDTPEQFLGVRNNVAQRLRDVTKKLYDLTKTLESTSETMSDALSELILDGFDDEQVWQELELQNNPLIPDFLADVSSVTAIKNVSFKRKGTSQIEEMELAKKSKLSELEEEDEDSEELDESDEDVPDHDDGDSEDDPLRLDQDENESDMSEEEKEMVALLAKARAALPQYTDDSDDDAVNADFDIDISSSAKSKSEPAEDTNESQSKKVSSVRKKAKRKTEVDDKFFSLADMESFLEQEDTKEERKIARESGKDVDDSADDEEIDYFADVPSDEEEGDEGITYDAFFDQPEGVELPDDAEKVSFSQREQDSESEEKDDRDDAESSEGEDISEVLSSGRKQQSSFQQRQERAKQKITKMEEEALGEKTWQHRGEVSSAARPENSLLQEDLEFEHTTKLAPVITEETTKTLEDMIKQRIKDKSWDDVERKHKPKEEAFEYKKRIVLDQEKSKQSLGEIYEKEYLKQQQKEETEEKDPTHEDIQKSMQSLFIKLDALSNFHYTPKPAIPEVKVISNLPSVVMEEVAPVGASDATLLAPEEVQDKQKGELKGDTEKSETDRKHERREKKKRQQEKFKHREAKAKALEERGLGNKYAKEKAMRDLEKQSKTGKGINIIKEDKTSKKSGLTSSNQFFTQLQEEVTAHVQSKKAAKKIKKSAEKSAAKYML